MPGDALVAPREVVSLQGKSDLPQDHLPPSLLLVASRCITRLESWQVSGGRVQGMAHEVAWGAPMHSKMLPVPANGETWMANVK